MFYLTKLYKVSVSLSHINFKSSVIQLSYFAFMLVQVKSESSPKVTFFYLKLSLLMTPFPFLGVCSDYYRVLELIKLSVLTLGYLGRASEPRLP